MATSHAKRHAAANRRTSILVGQQPLAATQRSFSTSAEDPAVLVEQIGNPNL